MMDYPITSREKCKISNNQSVNESMVTDDNTHTSIMKKLVQVTTQQKMRNRPSKKLASQRQVSQSQLMIKHRSAKSTFQNRNTQRVKPKPEPDQQSSSNYENNIIDYKQVKQQLARKQKKFKSQHLSRSKVNSSRKETETVKKTCSDTQDLREELKVQNQIIQSLMT